MNSRTGNNHASDLIKIPGVNEFDLGDKTLVEDRISCDNTINNYGNKLNSICKVHDLVIANGRVPGDRVGNFTCQTNRGASVVDYFISDHAFFNRLKQLVIHEPVFGSVHSPMSLTVDCSFDKTQAIKPPIPAPPRFIWDPTKREQFIGVLRSKLGKFTKMCSLLVNTSCTKGETTVLLKESTDIFYKSVLTCFRMAKPKKNLNKKRMKNQSKPWYNDSCQGLKRRLLNQARLLKKNPKDPYMRGAFISCKKEYRKSIKENKRIFEINKLDEIQSLTNNPKKFWKKLKGLLGKSKSHTDNYISPET